MKPIIEVKNISKQYKIGQKQGYLSLRDSVSDFFKFKKGNPREEDFWALNDVSFDVQAGESIGIIGRNGAGKSTLLKILSRITPPTKGKVILRGRIASLLEVGTGFHSELTGRENVFMNGSILGLRRAEITQKFDEIVAFSGVEQFIDTPLKHYSSGMQLRLAFAVAAHLEPEILVIDEVLAVGDAEFQKKCLGKMDEVSKSGRTVLFVSHNLSLLKAVCKTSILLNKGKIKTIGNIQDVISDYVNNVGSNVGVYKNLNPNPNNHIIEIGFLNSSDHFIDTMQINDEPVHLYVKFHIQSLKDFNMGFSIINEDGLAILSFKPIDETFDTLKKGLNIVMCALDSSMLKGGQYSLEGGIWSFDKNNTHLNDCFLRFTVENKSTLETKGVGIKGIMLNHKNWVKY